MDKFPHLCAAVLSHSFTPPPSPVSSFNILRSFPTPVSTLVTLRFSSRLDGFLNNPNYTPKLEILVCLNEPSEGASPVQCSPSLSVSSIIERLVVTRNRTSQPLRSISTPSHLPFAPTSPCPPGHLKRSLARPGYREGGTVLAQRAVGNGEDASFERCKATGCHGRWSTGSCTNGEGVQPQEL